MKIVALDFETANSAMASACSLGIAIYEDGEIIDNFEWYFHLSGKYNFFTNSHIHGIYPEDVENEKEFVFYYEQLSQILKDAVIIAHNAAFDIGVLNAECDLYGLDHFTNEYLDTVALSRRVYPQLYNHKLNTVARFLGVDLNHHNGCSDAFACLMILLSSMADYETYDLNELLEKVSMKLKRNQ